MIYENQALMDLIEEGKINGYIPLINVLKLIDEDSDDFDEFTKLIEAENIDLVRDEDIETLELDDDIDSDIGDDFDGFIGEIESDPEFNEFSTEVENDLKEKDIDDIVTTFAVPSPSDDPVRTYLREIGQIPLLTTIRELELSRTVQQGLLASEELRRVERGRKEISEEDKAKYEMYVAEGLDAREILIESNLRLVV